MNHSKRGEEDANDDKRTDLDGKKEDNEEDGKEIKEIDEETSSISSGEDSNLKRARYSKKRSKQYIHKCSTEHKISRIKGKYLTFFTH